MNVEKRINIKFALKYLAFWFSVFTFGFTVFLPVMQKCIEKEMTELFVFVGVMVIFILVNYLYWNYDLRKGIDKRKFIIDYLEYFKKDNFSKFQYIESLRWFSKNIHDIYLCKSEENEDVLKIVNKLHLVVNQENQGLYVATYHRDTFRELCERILENPDEERFSCDEQKLVDKMTGEHISLLTTFEFIKCMLFETPFVYFSLLVLNTVGCFFLADGSTQQFVGNFLIVIPSVVMLILGYFNILKDKFNQ